jgi:aspartyl-tRNA(Asn)/glutamyl-tRNA(Gln) amidotransferase subunit A
MTIREMGRLLRRGETCSVELIQDALRRIQEQDTFNTFITVTADSALREAVERDQERAAGIDRGPLHGIPIALKDLFYTRGVRTTAGSLLFQDFVPDRDAWVVDRLRLGGAVSLGKLNLHELAYGATSKNPHYGFLLNPHDPSRIAGGSSGGSAVAIAAGFVPATLGTDTGGSIRIPASYCGVAGFKPTYGRVSRGGVMPLSWSLDHVGPLGRTVEDCALMMADIAGHDPSDQASSATPVPDFCAPPPRRLHGLRVGVPGNFFFESVDTEVASAVHRAIGDLERLGAEVIDVHLPDLRAASACQRVIQWAEASAVHSAATDPTRIGAEVWPLIQQGRLISGSDYVMASRMRRFFRLEFDKLWEQVDVVAGPTTPVVAPRIAEEDVQVGPDRENVRLASTRLVRPVNLIGEPALSMPCGTHSNGLPIGLQLIAAPFADARLLRIGQRLERFMGELE